MVEESHRHYCPFSFVSLSRYIPGYIKKNEKAQEFGQPECQLVKPGAVQGVGDVATLHSRHISDKKVCHSKTILICNKLSCR